MAFSIDLVPKWVWFLLAAVVLAGVGGAGIYAVNTYTDAIAKRKEAESQRDQATAANATLTTQVSDLKEEIQRKENATQAIAAQQAVTNGKMESLNKDYQSALAERNKAQEAARIARKAAGVANTCTEDDALATVPKQPDISLQYAWKAYCELVPTAAECQAEKKP